MRGYHPWGVFEEKVLNPTRNGNERRRVKRKLLSHHKSQAAANAAAQYARSYTIWCVVVDRIPKGYKQ